MSYIHISSSPAPDSVTEARVLDYLNSGLPAATPGLLSRGEYENGWRYVLMSQLPDLWLLRSRVSWSRCRSHPVLWTFDCGAESVRVVTVRHHRYRSDASVREPPSSPPSEVLRIPKSA